MIDLRILGFADQIPMTALDRLSNLAWIGVLLNLLSGAMLYSADAVMFTANWPFRIKILLIILGAFSILILSKEIHRAHTTGKDATRRAKTIASLSIIFWIGAIFAGRLIAYV